MNRISKLFGISALLVLASCATKMEGAVAGSPKTGAFCSGDLFKCDARQCTIPVEVVACATPTASGSYGTLKVQEEFSVCSAKRMVWTLSDPNYKWQDNGIAFKPPSRVFNTQDHTDATYVVANSHGQLGTFPYAVTVVKKDGSPCAFIDPRINNEP